MPKSKILVSLFALFAVFFATGETFAQSPILVYRGESATPATHQPGVGSVSISYTLENTGNMLANGYRLVEYGTQPGGGATYPTFNIGVNQPGTARVNNFPVPDPEARENQHRIAAQGVQPYLGDPVNLMIGNFVHPGAPIPIC